MLSYLAAPGFQPFTIAGLILLGLLAVEIASLLVGHSASHLVDVMFGFHGAEIDADGHGGTSHIGTGHAGIHLHGGDGVFATIFDWINAGRVPLLILLMLLIGSFAVVGLAVQTVALHALTPLPAVLAVPGVALLTVPLTRWSSQLVAVLVPRDETYVLDDGDLVGRTGIVTLGPVQEGAAARAKIQDRHGNWHFPRVRPARPDLVIPQGASILVVDHAGKELAVVPAEGRLA
jgi:hypothetical protein